MYIPGKGTVMIQPETGFSHTEYSLDSDADVKSNTLEMNLSAGYGLSDYFALYADCGWSYSKTKVEESTSFKSKGIEDPSIGFKFRLPTDIILFDIFSSYSPYLIKSRDSDGKKDGNMGRGGHEVYSGFNIGNKYGTFEYAFGFDSEIFSKRKSESGDVKSETTGGDIFEATVYIRKFSDENKKIYLTTGLIFDYTTKTTTKYSDGCFEKTDPLKLFGLNFGIGFIIVPEKSLLDFSFTVMRAINTDCYSRTKNDYPFSPYITDNYTKKGILGVGLQVGMRFQI